MAEKVTTETHGASLISGDSLQHRCPCKLRVAVYGSDGGSSGWGLRPGFPPVGCVTSGEMTDSSILSFLSCNMEI